MPSDEPVDQDCYDGTQRDENLRWQRAQRETPEDRFWLRLAPMHAVFAGAQVDGWGITFHAAWCRMFHVKPKAA